MSEMRNAADLQIEYDARERIRDAAPDMLAALKRMKRDVSDHISGRGSRRFHEDQLADITKAIAKAEGHTP